MKKDVKKQIVQMIKEAWTEEVRNIEDVEVLEKQNKHYLKALKQIELIQLEDNESLLDTHQSNQASSKETDEYIFIRHILGGEGVNLETGQKVFVPESVVRNEMLEQGNKLIFEENANGYNRHGYKKISSEKDDNIDSVEIVGYDYAIVDYDESINRFICKKYFDSGEIVNIPTCLLNEKDVIKFNIQEDDIVSIAHFPNHTTSRIRWKYDSDEIIPTPIKRKSSYYKETDGNKVSNDGEKDLFKNIEVGILGASQFINNYIEEVEQRGGKVHHTESDVQAQVDTLVSKSDIVVIPILHVSHAKAEQAKARAKKEEKPYIILKNSGRSSFINELKEYLHLT